MDAKSINTNITIDDISLSEYTPDKFPLIRKLRDAHFKTPTEVCIERAAMITRYMKRHSEQNGSVELLRAKAVSYYLSEREALFHDDNLLAGATTSKSIGAPLYPEFLGLTIWPELETISTRSINPQILTKEDQEKLNMEIFPFWIDGNVLEETRKRFDNPKCMKLFERVIFYIAGKAGCISHCVPTYERALHIGLNAVIKEAAEKEASLLEGPHDDEKREQIDFYQAVQISMQGIINYAQNLSKKAATLAESESDQERRENLIAMSDVCKRVPAEPARNFREAVNSLWLCQVGIHGENINMAMSPGRLDQVLYPFYEKDRDENGLTTLEALNICCCLWLKIADNTNLVPESAEKLWGGAGSTPAVTLGGVDPKGQDAVNDLTYIFLKVTELMSFRDPSVNARYHYDANSRAYRQRLAEVIVNTKAIPAVHNDVADAATLMNQGLTSEHANDYAIVGCVELASTGRDYVASSSIMLNLSSAMEMALLNGRRFISPEEQVGPETGDPREFRSFEQFREAFEIQLKWLLENAIQMNEYFGKVHQDMLPTPLLSAFFEGCMDTGRDLIRGGTLYNSSGASFLAFPDVCDSLNAVEYAVFEKKKLTMSELIDAVKSDYAPPHDKHLPFLTNKTPRFGSEDPIALNNSKNLVKFIYKVCQSHKNYRGGPYRPAYWTMTTHAGQGKLCGALPSGRKAHQVFSSGITPASQAAQDLVQAFNAVASLPGECIPGGEALNIKYTPIAVGEDRNAYLERFGDLVEGYFRKGGLQAQFNVQTYETFIEAKKHPEKYPEMIVRVSGYSAYFKDLSDPMKDELITRTQYDLIKGRAVPLPSTWKGE